MKNLYSLILCASSFLSVTAQVPDTDIFLIEIRKDKNKLEFGKPVNITDRPGYDNQPVFSKGSDRIYYVSMEDTTQTDIIEYNIREKQSKKTAETPESEYSPAQISGTQVFSVVRVDADKGQRLYMYESDPASAELLIDGIDSVGYYHWMNDTTVALVVLNNGFELYVYEMYSHQFIIAAKNIGRCLLTEPASGNLIFTTTTGDETSLMKLNPETFEIELLCQGYKGSKDYIITPEGELWTGWEGKLYALDLNGEKQWKQIADFSESAGNFYRLAISGNAKYLAIVAFKGERP